MFLNRVFFVCFFLTASFSNAQQKQTVDSLKMENLDEVMVTATRTVRQLSSLPLPVQLISKEQIKLSGSLRLNDILDEQTGLIIVPDFGGVLGIQMQGLDAQYTLILIDGVPLVGRSAGTFDLSRVAVNNVKQIEIVKGPSSGLYGSEAIGGVINIITETPKETPLKGDVSYRLGSYLTQDANVGVTFGKGKTSFNAYVDAFSSEGYDLDKSDAYRTLLPYKNVTSQLQFQYKASEKWRALVSARYFGQDGDLESVIDDESASGNTITNEFNIHTRVFHNPNKNLSLTYEVYGTQYHTNDETRFDDSNELAESGFYKENLLRPETRATYRHGNVVYTAGFGYSFNNLDRTFFAEKINYNSYYGYGQYDFTYKKWNVLAGARYDKNDAYASAFSPKLAVNFKANESVSFKASVGYGFKAPDLRQLYFDFNNPAVGYIVLGYNVAANRLVELQSQGQIENILVPGNFFDSPLKTENSIGYNFGIDHRYKKVKSSVNVFYNNVENLIDTKVVATLANGQNVFSYTNVGSVFTAGLEVNSQVQVTDNLQISGGYQYLIAKDNDVIDAIENGEIYARDPETQQSFQLGKSDYFGLFNRSKHTANLKTTWKIPAWKASHTLRATYRSKYGLFDTNNNQILDNYDTFAKEYVTLDTSFTKEISDNIELQLGMDNILNFTDTQNASNIAGRLIYWKVRYQF
ncbi:MAG TPA: TonB-dependent receptor [Flavobacterium sp.]|nr:TonB-dependent receptor [Flavobacterium sp.]